MNDKIRTHQIIGIVILISVFYLSVIEIAVQIGGYFYK